MATLTVNKLTKSGVAETLVAADAAGDDYPISGKEFLIIDNANASNPRTVTIASNENCNQGFDHDTAVTVAALSRVLVGPLEKTRYDDGAGSAQITYSDSGADITIGVFQNEA